MASVEFFKIAYKILMNIYDELRNNYKGSTKITTPEDKSEK